MAAPILALCLAILQGDQHAWETGPPLPIPVANNAVAAVITAEGPAVFSFLGLDSTKRWDGILPGHFDGMSGYDVNRGTWHSFPSLPEGSMDHRGMVAVADRLVGSGGMGDTQTVTRRVSVALIERLRPLVTR